MKKDKETTEPQRLDHKEDLPPTPHDPIEPDPMNPKQQSASDNESHPQERPDLNWAEHED